jgi:hypothetical protein
MIFRVDIWPAASKDADLAADWFDRQRPGLGRDFLVEVDRTVTRVAEYPESCQRFYASLRRALLHRFHYAVVYRIQADAVQIIGIIDCRRRATELLSRVVNPELE